MCIRDRSLELGYEDLFNQDLNNDSLIGIPLSVDENSDGLVDNRLTYNLMSTDSNAIALTSKDGKEYSDASSRFWDVIAATPTDTGYDVLLEGATYRYQGQYLVWSTDPNGVINGNSGWKSTNQAVELGFEDLFNQDLNNDSLIGTGSSYPSSLVNEGSSYQLLTADGAAISLTNQSGKVYSDDSSRFWDAVAALQTDTGYEVLLEGATSRYSGKYLVWKTDDKGCLLYTSPSPRD